VVVEAFHRLHEQYYSVRAAADPVEMTEWNLMAVGKAPPIDRIPAAERQRSPAAIRPQSHRKAYLKEAGGAIDLPVFGVDDMRCGGEIAGPALIQDVLTVTLVPPGARAILTENDSIFISVGAS